MTDLVKFQAWLKTQSEIIEKLQCKKPGDIRILLYFLDTLMETEKWQHELPYITWPSEWEVRFYPTFSALLRLNVRLKSDPEKWTSIYFDGYDALGCYGSPYWEVFCPGRSECWRFDMSDINGLFEQIREIFNYDGPLFDGEENMRVIREFVKDANN